MERLKNVLIVDDDETSIFVAKKVLKSIGVFSNVLSAKSGLDGLRMLKEAKEKGQQPQLILLDVHMHQMGGFAFLEEVGKTGYVNLIDTKIVLLTNSQNPLVIESAKKHLAAEYLVKPLTKEKLMSVLD